MRQQLLLVALAPLACEPLTAGVDNGSRGISGRWPMRPNVCHRQVLNKSANAEGWQKWRPSERYGR